MRSEDKSPLIPSCIFELPKLRKEVRKGPPTPNGSGRRACRWRTALALSFILSLSACMAPQRAGQTQFNQTQSPSQFEWAYEDLVRGNLDDAYAGFWLLAQAGDAGAMNNLGVVEARRGNVEEAKKWYSWAALIGSVLAADNLGAGPKQLTFGMPLNDDILMCDLLLDSIYVLPDFMALLFKIQNRYSRSSTEFSVNAVTVDRGSTPYLHGAARNARTRIAPGGYRLFSAILENTASEASVSITCASDTDIVRVPLSGRQIQAAIDSFGYQPAPAGLNEVPFVKLGGVYEVQVELNDVLKIRLIIDSGASEVLIAPDVALTLYRTGTITESDWLPGKTYRFADGSTAQSARFLLKRIKIGNRSFDSVPCAISSQISAPMLLGQSVLERLGKYTFDYDRGVIVFQ